VKASGSERAGSSWPASGDANRTGRVDYSSNKILLRACDFGQAGVFSAGSGVSIVSISQSSVTFTYTIENDNQLVTNFDVGTFETIAGAGTGNIGTFSARPARHAQIGNGANAIVSGPAEDILDETLTYISGPSKGLVQHRVCTRSSISVKQ